MSSEYNLNTVDSDKLPEIEPQTINPFENAEPVVDEEIPETESFDGGSGIPPVAPPSGTAPKPSGASRLPLLLSLLALAGVVFILAVHGFKPREAGHTPQPMVKSSGEPVTGTRIAYVRADSVQGNYLMTIYFLDSIERRFRSMENDLMEKKKGYEKKVSNYYRDVQSGLLKESAALQIKEKLEVEGDQIAETEENYTKRINDLQLKLNIIYFDSLWNFLERHKEAIGFDMVVGYQQGLTNIFFADKGLDITQQVIDLMNQEYLAIYPNRKDLKKK
ncbi:MAG TPA: OmpH family outer membrane protein [Bacteroidales bacterium]|nr:OmpH family outer membrane protein [Bacteroidales bacterium]HRZ47857.1 OmpH family outer membrane protein [Bacteroidales bacterium]